MGKGLPRSMSRGAAQRQEVLKQSIVVENVALSVAGATGVGWATAVIGDLPEGNILLLGAVSYMQFFTADANPAATYDGDYAIGTTPTADATITGTDANIIPSTALGAATAKLSPLARGTQADGAFTGVVLDNTDGSLELNLQLLIDDANISANGVPFTANGVLHLAYIVLGDD